MITRIEAKQIVQLVSRKKKYANPEKCDNNCSQLKKLRKLCSWKLENFSFSFPQTQQMQFAPFICNPDYVTPPHVDLFNLIPRDSLLGIMSYVILYATSPVIPLILRLYFYIVEGVRAMTCSVRDIDGKCAPTIFFHSRFRSIENTPSILFIPTVDEFRKRKKKNLLEEFAIYQLLFVI